MIPEANDRCVVNFEWMVNFLMSDEFRRINDLNDDRYWWTCLALMIMFWWVFEGFMKLNEAPQGPEIIKSRRCDHWVTRLIAKALEDNTTVALQASTSVGEVLNSHVPKRRGIFMDYLIHFLDDCSSFPSKPWPPLQLTDSFSREKCDALIEFFRDWK